MLFTGHAEVIIDAKGRLAIPAKYRGQLKAEVDGTAWYCVPWKKGQLRLYTEKKFEVLAEQGQQGLTPGEDMAEMEATFFGFAERLEPDSTGRIVVPKNLLEMAGLGSEVVVVGARNRLEVRDRSAWETQKEERFNKMPTLVERIEAKQAGRSE